MTSRSAGSGLRMRDVRSEPPCPESGVAVVPGVEVHIVESRGATPVVSVTEPEILLDPARRARLVRLVVKLARKGTTPRVLLERLDTDDRLLVGAILALLLLFNSGRPPIFLLVDSTGLTATLHGAVEAALARPAELLRVIDRALLHRLHALIGAGDHASVERLSPLLRFIHLIGHGDAHLEQQLADTLRVRKRNIQFMVTRRCHLRCVYCPVEKRDADLPFAAAERGLELLLHSSAPEIRVDFTGGEPFLREAWVRDFMTLAHHRALEVGKQLSFYLVTNAIELTEPTCRFLSDFDIELELSVDGTEAAHNLNKIAVDEGLNPYRRFLAGFQHVQRTGMHYNAVLVFTPSSFASLPSNLEHVLSLGFRNISVNYAIGNYWPAETIEQYTDLLASLVKKYDMLGNPRAVGYFFENLRNKSEPTVLNSEVMLDTDGSLHLLSEWQFRRELRRRPPPIAFDIGEVKSIDEVFYTKAQVYHLLYEMYCSAGREVLRVIHNNVETGFTVATRVREIVGSPLRAACSAAL